MNLQKETTIQLTIKGWHGFVMGVLVTLIMFGGISACYQGRDFARWTGVAQRVDLPDDLTSYNKIISVSFHKNENGETLKDITYISADGLMRSKEYKDWGLLEGEIIWNLTAKQQ